MKIAVVGAGGVGGYFGARLAQGGADVRLIARGEHLAALRRDGLEVRSPKGDARMLLPAVSDPADVGPCDCVLFCVKAYDTQAAARSLGPLLGDATAVVSLQNGVDNEERIAEVVGWPHVVGGSAYIFSTVVSPGVVAHTGGPARLVFGEWDGQPSARVDALLDACRSGGIDAEASDDIRTQLWDKYAFLCAQAGMTAAAGVPLGEIRSTPEAWAMFRRLVQEVCALARAEGVALPADAADRHVRFAEGLEAGSYSSLHHDLTHERPMELEALHGTVVRRARAAGVAVPMNEAVLALLRPHALRYERR